MIGWAYTVSVMIAEMTRIHVLACPDGTFYAAATAVVVGDVTVGHESSFWHHVAVRGDVAAIRIGRRVNVQDGAVLHCQYDVPLDIAHDVGIGHGAVVHCAAVGSRTLIGIKSVLLDGARVGEDCIIAAGALVTQGMTVPDGSVVMGVPGRIVRETSDADRAYLRMNVEAYVQAAKDHAAGRFPPIADAGRP